jgi:hypothetical protein
MAEKNLTDAERRAVRAAGNALAAGARKMHEIIEAPKLKKQLSEVIENLSTALADAKQRDTSAQAVELRDAKARDIDPVVETARAALPAIKKACNEIRPQLSEVLRLLDVENRPLRQILPDSSWVFYDQLCRHAFELWNTIEVYARQISEQIKMADELTSVFLGARWRSRAAEIVQPLHGINASAATSLRERWAQIEAGVTKLNHRLEEARATSTENLLLERPRQEVKFPPPAFAESTFSGIAHLDEGGQG